MMQLRITAVYPGAEGRPQSIEVAWSDVNPATIDVGAMLDRLMTVPDRTQQYAVTESPAVDDACRRLVCGHPREVHDTDGPCRICGTIMRCASFVGRSAEPAPKVFVAGERIEAGQRLELTPDGFTISPAGHPLDGVNVGVARESFDAGDVMERLPLPGDGSRGTLWIKKRETA